MPISHRIGTVLLCWMLLEVYSVQAKLELIYNYDVEAVYHKKVQLLCKIDTDKIVKKVVWYRLTESMRRSHVYYYEPPKFNASGPDYKNRVRLAHDNSSLVILSVEREDEGLYECHATVVRNLTNFENELPEEAWQVMKLTVHFPPTSVKLSSFTSNKNMTLTCRGSGSKPEPDIYWLLRRNHEVKEYRSAKIVSEYHGELVDTIGYFYMSLSHKDQGINIACIVDHPQTQTSLRDNITLVSPTLLHPVMMYFDWLGAEVPYSAFDINEEKPSVLPSGLVKMLVSPAQLVEGNSTVIVTVSSDGSFPEPRYTWWSEDLDLRSGQVIRIESIQRNQLLFCLVENPVGRVVVSMQLSVAGSGSSDSGPNSSPNSENVAISGVLVMAIVFGVLVLVLVVAFLVYYCVFKPTDEKNVETDRDDFDSYLIKQKLPDQEQQFSDQTKISSYHNEPEILSTNEKQNLLTSAFNSTSKKDRKDDNQTTSNSSTTTSGYGGDLGPSNGVESKPSDRRSSDGKKRAISQHLQDFDENASFVGDYGSSFGLDTIPKDGNNDMTRSDNFEESENDDRSYDSGTSGVEGRYTLPPRDSESWEHLDPRQIVEPHHQPTEL